MADAQMTLSRPMELRSVGPRAASSMELVLTSTTHGLASGKELVSSSEESRKSEFALWPLALDDFQTNRKMFVFNKVDADLRTWRKKQKEKDPCPFAYEVVALMKQQIQQLEESFELTVTTLVSQPKPNARARPVLAPSRHPNAQL